MCLKEHLLLLGLLQYISFFQDSISKEELLSGLYLEFINRVNEVGVDINKAVVNPNVATLVQFISGLGPRKGGALLKVCIWASTREILS